MSSGIEAKPSWLQHLPPSIVPYAQLARLHYFDGPNLFLWSSVMGLTLAAAVVRLPLSQFVTQIAIHAAASILLHSVGSTWDDICDKEIDAQVERTKNRPLVRGAVSVSEALAFMFPQVWLLVELLRLSNSLAFYIGVFGLSFFVPLYPLMKRVTYWPQAWLGLILAICLLVGYSSVTGSLDLSTTGALLVGNVCWCIYYDTIYGAMDLKDDLRIGVKSTAVLFGAYTRHITALFAFAFVVSLGVVGQSVNASPLYHIFAVIGTAMHFTWQVVTLNLNDNASCLRIFQSNATQLGYIIWIGFLSIYWRALNE